MLTALREALERHELIYLGVTRPGYDQAYERFKRWISEKKHAGMAFLEEHAPLRQDPHHLLEGSQSVVAFALPYFHPLADDAPRVARYAHFADYHKLLKARATAAVEEWKAKNGAVFSYRVLVDSAPLLERAQVAQLPEVFIGKNTCLIHAERGSFLLLGEVFLTLDLGVIKSPAFDSTKRQEGLGCGPCTSCQVACPTGALDEAFQLDAKKCLAYWTIEHRGTIPREYWKWMADYWYGCDLCQTACPYNTHAKQNRLPASLPLKSFPPLNEVATMSQAQYERFFGGTPMTRAKKNGLRRNALIAMAVTHDAHLPEVLRGLTSESDPVLVETITEVRDYLAHHEKTESHLRL